MSQQLSICFVSQEYPTETGWGGIGSYTHEIAHGLARLGHKVWVLSRALQQEQRYEEVDGVTVYRILPRTNLGRLPLLWRLNQIWEGYHLTVAMKLREMVRCHAIDIIEVPGLHGETAFFQYMQRQFPVVVRLHSCPQKTMKLNNIQPRLSLQMSRWYEKQIVDLTRYLTAPSRSIAQDNMAFLPLQNGKQVKIIPNPIDTMLFRPAANGSTFETDILFVGRLAQQKGAHILALAMPLVWQQAPQARFTFVGNDGQAPNGSSMKQWILNYIPASKQNLVTFIDHIPRQELVRRYQQARMVVFPSLGEAFGYTAAEAMACGKAVIATRCGGPEDMIDNGQTGFLIPANDAERLAQQIIQLLNNGELCRMVGRAAREKICSGYDTQVISRQMAQFYQAVLENGQPS